MLPPDEQHRCVPRRARLMARPAARLHAMQTDDAASGDALLAIVRELRRSAKGRGVAGHWQTRASGRRRRQDAALKVERAADIAHSVPRVSAASDIRRAELERLHAVFSRHPGLLAISSRYDSGDVTRGEPMASRAIVTRHKPWRQVPFEMTQNLRGATQFWIEQAGPTSEDFPSSSCSSTGHRRRLLK